MKTKTILSIFCLLSAYCLLLTANSEGAVPSLINYQGVLKDSTGVPQNGEFAMKFCIYNDSIGGDSLWGEEQTVHVTNGLFNVLLGSVDSIPSSVFYDPDTWLQVEVGGSVLSPRRRIVSVGYALTDGDWTIDGVNIYREQGNVGIGTTTPEIYKLDVRGDTRMGGCLRFADSTGAVYPHNWIGMAAHVEGTKKWLHIGGIEDNTGDNLRRVGLWGDKIYLSGNVGIGTFYPAYKLDVEGYVQAYGYYTGDIIFQKDKEKLWRMFEDEDGLYLENLKTGKVYRFVLQEVEKE